MTMKVEYGNDDGGAAGRQLTYAARFGFDETISELEAAIAAEDLWIVARLDPKMLLAKAGFSIHPARQLFYFHPRFMARLLSSNPAAIVEVPLKIVVMEARDGSIRIRHPDIFGALASYERMTSLATELTEINDRIVSSVAVRQPPTRHAI